MNMILVIVKCDLVKFDFNHILLYAVFALLVFLETSQRYGYQLWFKWNRFFKTYIKCRKNDQIKRETLNEAAVAGIKPITAIGRSYLTMYKLNPKNNPCERLRIRY